MEKKQQMLALQISLILIFTGSLGGMFAFTDVYDNVQKGIVEVLCLSCIKLQPKTTTDFTFKTANGQAHPDFVKENLTKGPVFLQYSKSDCDYCDEMFERITNFFNLSISYKTTKFYHKTINFKNQNVTYVYIYYDPEDKNIPEKIKESWRIYDKEHIKGFPMFTLITKEYHRSGNIKPYYTTLYGRFKESEEKTHKLLNQLLTESIEMYKRNTPT